MRVWRLSEVCKAAKVTVRTLHYYDKIGLLRPSGRLSNGYRFYSDTALIKLKKISALKFFGFTLARIVELIGKDDDDEAVLMSLRNQLTLLRREISRIQETQIKLLQMTIEYLEKRKEVDWNITVDLMQSYEKLS